MLTKSPNQTKFLVPFQELSQSDVPTGGGKGANLGELTTIIGNRVPPGFVVTTDTFRAVAETIGLSDLIAQHLDNLDYQDQAALAAASAAIKAAFTLDALPEDVAEAIVAAWEALGSPAVAVRSSATAEDLPDASFAGQQLTRLNIRTREGLLQAVVDCLASLYEARSIHYRHENGFAHRETHLAVVIQTMVDAVAAGVMFTRHPDTPSKSVIEAVYGLGERLVGGLETPDTYLVNGDDIIVRTFGQQKQKLIRREEANEHGEFNAAVPLDESEQSQQVLDNELIYIIWGIGQELQSHYGCPQDVEFCVTADRKIYVVQSRPITVEAQSNNVVPMETETAMLLVSATGVGAAVGCGQVRILQDASPEELAKVQPGDVLVTDMTTPDMEPVMKTAAGIVTRKGGATCHAAIIAREHGIATVVGVANLSVFSEGMEVTVDGKLGHVYQGRAEKRLTWWEAQQEADRQIPLVETNVKVGAIISSVDTARTAVENGADLVGLLRLEMLLAGMKDHPGVFVQEGRQEEWVKGIGDIVAEVCGLFGDQPVILRTSDNKTNEYRNLGGGHEFEPEEENPMLGWRGCGRYRDTPDQFAMECEMIKYVWDRIPHQNLKIMLPFVRTPEEFVAVRQVMIANGVPIGATEGGIALGMMVELPTNVIRIEDFIAAGAEFFSIGSNDLTQLTLGIDRDATAEDSLRETFNECDPSLMWLYERAITASMENNIPIGFCGQAPSNRPELVQKLVEWGITSISVTTDRIRPTNQLVAQAEGRS